MKNETITNIRKTLEKMDKKDNWALELRKGRYSMIELDILTSLGSVRVISVNNREDIFKLEQDILALIDRYVEEKDHMAVVINL